MKKNPEKKPRAKKSSLPKGGNGAVNHVDIAREAGVSPGLVSAYFSGNHYRRGQKGGIGIGDATRRKIKETCLRLNYIPDDPVGFFKLYPDKADVGFLLSDEIFDGFANPYHSLVFEGFARRALGQNVDMSNLIFRGQHDYLMNPTALPNPILRGAIQKVAVTGGALNYSLIQCLLKMEVFVVIVGQAPPIDGIVSVVADYFEAARQGLHKLYEHGHRHIVMARHAYMSLDRYNGKMFWEGCSAGQRELGLSLDESCFLETNQEKERNTPGIASQILAMNPRPTAVFCWDDNMARVLSRKFMEAGLSVPKDISILGCNDDRLNQEMQPGFSTFHLPLRRIGERACDELNRISVEGAPKNKHETIVLPFHYVENGSIRKI